jgi:hypothetical protein
MRENRTSGSMRGYWGLATAALVRHRQTKGAETARRDLTLRLPGSTLPFRSDWITLWCAVVSVLVRGLSAMGRVALLAACRFRNFALRVAGGLSDRHRPPHREVAICDLTV